MVVGPRMEVREGGREAGDRDAMLKVRGEGGRVEVR